MPSKKLQSGLLPQIREYQDPWGLGFAVRIRRSGHPKATANTLQEARASLAIMSAYNDAQERLKREGKTAPKDLAKAAVDDPCLAAVLGEAMSRTKEFQAVSCVAGWRNVEGASEEFFELHQLPKGGAFTRQDVADKFLDAFGEEDADEAFVLPPFMTSDLADFVRDPEILQQAAEIIVGHLDGMAKLTKGKSKGKGKSKKADEDEEAATAAMRAAVDELASDRDAKLAALGIVRTPHAGQDLRTAVVLWIIDKATELQEEHHKGKAFLSPASN